MTDLASELNINRSNLEQALRDALKSVLEKDGHSNPRTRFYNRFKAEVAEHDDDFLQTYNADLDTTLIFSGLFSAITAAFIIDIQSDLKPDYQKLNNALLELLLNATVGNAPPGQPVSPPRWTGPNPGIRQVQATLYATLCGTLFAAFLATLGKQWLNRYRQTDIHGPIEDRCRDRERKLSGIHNWQFHIVMQSAPVMIQSSLALLGVALSRYLWEVDHTVASVVIGFMTFTVLLFAASVVISVLHFDCPFQTPLSLLIRSIVDKVEVWWKKRHRDIPVATNLADLIGGGLTVGAAQLVGLQQRVLRSSLSLSWEQGYRLDARCITRMFGMSTDMTTIRLTMDFVQDVIWDSRIKNIPLGWIYEKLISCFDFTHSQTPILIAAYRDIAYLSAKAFTHIHFQQQYILQSRGTGPVGGAWRPDTPHPRLGYPGPRVDPDLGSALRMVDMALGTRADILWDRYQLSPAHHLWVSHLFVYHAVREPLSDEVSAFVKYSLDPDKSPSDAVITDCLYIINIILGAHFRIEDLTRRNKSSQMNAMIQRIFLNLLGRFQISNPPINPPTDVDVWERPLRALDLITRLTNATVSTGSYELFNTIMASAVEQERKMEAARLALHAAYPRGPGTVPPAQDPKLILNFLRSHVDPTVRRIDDAISSAMHAIDSASDNPDSRSWTWRIENAGELLDRFEGSPRPEEFKWWFGVLWLHYGGLDPDVQRKIEEIGKSGDARVDLKQYRIAIVKEIERVKGLDGATDIIRDLEGAYDRLTALIDPWEKSRHLRGLHIVRDYRRPSLSLESSLQHSYFFHLQ